MRYNENFAIRVVLWMLPLVRASVQLQPSQCFPHSESDLVHCARSFIISTRFTYLFVCGITGTKKTSAKDSGEKKRMSIEVKQGIIQENMSVVCECLNWQGGMTTVHVQFASSVNKRMQ